MINRNKFEVLTFGMFKNITHIRDINIISQCNLTQNVCEVLVRFFYIISKTESII